MAVIMYIVWEQQQENTTLKQRKNTSAKYVLINDFMKGL